MPTLRAIAAIAILIAACAPAASPSPQQPQAPAAQAAPPRAADPRPLPGIPALLRDIAKNQQALEDMRQLYTCHLSEEQDKVDSDGKVKSRELKDYDLFYIGDDAALHLLAKDGKPLTGSEKKSEDDKFSKRYDKLKKKQAELAADPKKQQKKAEEDEARISDFLRAARFTNPRRETFRGHEVIALDLSGNPDYKPQNRIESVVQKLAGTAWVDEQARQVARLEAHFSESVKIGGGLVASLSKGSNFVFEQQKISDEAWLPSYVEVHFSGRIVFVKLKQNFVDRFTDYKKFRSGASLGATSAPSN